MTKDRIEKFALDPEFSVIHSGLYPEVHPLLVETYGIGFRRRQEIIPHRKMRDIGCIEVENMPNFENLYGGRLIKERDQFEEVVSRYVLKHEKDSLQNQ